MSIQNRKSKVLDPPLPLPGGDVYPKSKIVNPKFKNPLASVAVTNNPSFFQFEADFVNSLRCIPMQVRLKLDTCGVKLNLAQWHQFTATERQQLVDLPCSNEVTTTAYRNYLQSLVCGYQGNPAKTLPIDPAPAWLDDQVMPSEVEAQAASLGHSLTLTQWQALTPLQRFALIKLSRSGHENRNFRPALMEFGLV